MSLRTVTSGLILASALIGWTGCSTMRANQAAGNPDEFFMVEAAQTNLAEIAVGRLAAERGTSPEVKQYGQKIVDDHTRANEELKQLAKKKGVALPTRPDEQHGLVAKHLKELSGATFDREFITHMHGDHAKVVSLFEDKSQAAKDPELRAWAGRMVPVLQEHLKTAASLNQELGGSSNMGM